MSTPPASSTKEGANPHPPWIRRLESRLAWFTLAALLVYAPAESFGALDDLSSPGYVVDAIAMLLLLAGSLRSLRSRPRPAAGFLCGAWGWSACLAWRSYFTRVISRERDLGIYPPESRWQEDVLLWALVVALAAFALSLVLAWKSGEAPP